MERLVSDFERDLKGVHSKKEYKRLLDMIEECSKEELGIRNQYSSKLVDWLRHSNIKVDYNSVFIDYSKTSEERESLEKIIENDLELPANNQDVEMILISKIEDSFKDAPIPSDFLERIVNNVCKRDNDPWQLTLPLRLKILKRFIMYGRSAVFEQSGAGYGGKSYIYEYALERAKINNVTLDSNDDAYYELIAQYLDDGIFDVISNRPSREKDESKDKFKERKKEFRKKYELILIIDDLANGRFRTNQSTKKDLYIFAMVFDMTFNYKNRDLKQIPYNDIRTELFEKYYTNNIKRVYNVNQNGELNQAMNWSDYSIQYEAIPAESGINYKNFAELVYVYYIANTTEPKLKPDEKIKKSSEMINYLVEEGKEQDKQGFLNTIQSREKYIEDILSSCKDETAFKDYIIRNIDIKVPVNKKGMIKNSPLNHCASSATAFDVYNDIKKKIEEYDEIEIHSSLLPIACLSDGSKEIIDIVNRLLNANNVSSDNEITRTGIVSAVFKLFILKNNTIVDPHSLLGFEDIYNAFVDMANIYLGKAGYSEISSRNLFDVLVILLTYSYISVEEE